MDPKVKPSVFISYAHKDSMEFTRRLVFSLGMYMDVFWDRRLQSGPYPSQLFSEIEKRDFFLFVQSPYAEDCKGDKIVLARLFSDCHSPLQKELESKYTFGAFDLEFEQGFRRITQMMLGQPLSSWEIMYYENDDSRLLSYVAQGYVPGVIVKEFVEWVIVTKLWGLLEDYLQEVEEKGHRLLYGKPRTVGGIGRELQPILTQFAEYSDSIGCTMISEIQPIVDAYLQQIETVNDNEHVILGRVGGEILFDIEKLLEEWAMSKINAFQTLTVQTKHKFDTADKLRELIKWYARRSRNLY